MQIKAAKYIFLTNLLSFFFLAQSSYAEKSPVLAKADYNEEDYRVAPSKLYKKSRWRLKMNGPLMSPLDPEIWGYRKFDRVDNRLLVSIRPFYLRVSDTDPSFRLRKITAEIYFEKMSYQNMKVAPHVSAPLLDVIFGEEIETGLSGQRLKVDRGYIHRLNAFANLHSGLYYRNREKILSLATANSPMMRTGQWHRIDFRVSSSEAIVYVNGKTFSKIKGRDFDKGLVGLLSGWHPVQIRNLNIRGIRRIDGKEVKYQESGLIDLHGDTPNIKTLASGDTSK